MSWGGKLIWGLIGWFIGGPIGLFLGVIFGHLIDEGLFKHWLLNKILQRNKAVQRVFFSSTFLIMGYIAKSDGRVTENEIRAAEKVMRQMSLNAAMREEAINLFNEGKKPNFNITDTLNKLKAACVTHPMLLKTFLEIQIQIAHADGHLSHGKRVALESISQQLGARGAGGFTFEQFERQYHQYQNYQRHYQQPFQQPQQQLNEAYELLEISKNATDDEVKRAYRVLMSKNHPDKLIAKGVPPEMIKLATQKTQQIKQAYEQIKAARGF